MAGPSHTHLAIGPGIGGMIAVGVAGQRHPHILLIVLDDAGYNDFDWMGTANNQFYTPFLRGMAERGVLLKHHYTYVLACVPSLGPPS